MIGDWDCRLPIADWIVDWRLGARVSDGGAVQSSIDDPVTDPSIVNEIINHPIVNEIGNHSIPVGNRSIADPLVANRQSAVGNERWVS